MRKPIAIVHDYLTQRGGAERVVLAMARAFPDAPIHTALYNPTTTFPEFRNIDVRPMFPNRLRLLRTHHRLALPVLSLAFSLNRVDADTVLCSSSGWSHGVRATGRKIVYCHTPARWLYQTDRYLASSPALQRTVFNLIRGPLLRWDHRAAATADAYLTQSSTVHDRIRAEYSRESLVIPAPVTLQVSGEREGLPGLDPGFILCVSRLLRYKNVHQIVQALHNRPDQRLVIVGTGPEETSLRNISPRNVLFLGSQPDIRLRWLYGNCSALVAASHEDYGLTPIEAAGFGKPSAVLRWGGFLDTVEEGITGVFFDQPTPGSIRDALDRLASSTWSADSIQRHASRYSEAEFARRLRGVVMGREAGFDQPIPSKMDCISSRAL